MIPLRDINPRRRFPIVTLLIILMNVIVFAYEWMLTPAALDRLAFTWGLIPAQLMTFRLEAIVRVFTSMFLHGGLMHLAGNMLYLWIFGDNVEGAMGSFSYLVFYLLCGIGAAIGQVAVGPSSTVPMIGASGAISGVLGAYLVLYPGAQVETLLFVGFFVRLVRLPALVLLGMWILLQFVSGLASLGIDVTGGVAFFAHVGGFVAGVALVGLFRRRRWWD